MRENNCYGGAHLLLAFIAGGVAGAAIALLSAPQSGSETRGTIRGWARTAQGKAVRIPDALRSAYNEASEAARRAFVEALAEESPSSES